ncbi:hypothetical protein Tco_0002490 [Tanacetum coccineum]
MPFVTSSVTLTLEHEGSDNTDSIYGPNLQTQCPDERFVISSDTSHYSSTKVADVEVTSIVGSHLPPPRVMTAVVTTTVVAATAVVGVTSALVLGVGIELVHTSIFVDSASISTVGPDIVGPSQPARTELSADTFHVSYKMDSQTLQQIFACFSAEVRLRSEHNYRERKKFKKKCNRQADLLKEKDAEIVSLKAQLSLKEVGATEAIHLRSQVSIAEAVKVTRVGELNNLKERNSVLEEEKGFIDDKITTLESTTVARETELTIKASSLESQRDGLIGQVSLLETTCSGLRDQVSDYELFKEQIETVQDEQVKLAGEYVAALGAAIGLAIDKGMQTGLVASIDHGKAGRGLTEVATYDTSMEGKYVSAVFPLCDLEFNLLPQLELLKDASIADIMIFLHLEGPSVETPKGIRLQPSYEQLLLPMYRTEDNAVIGETSVSDSLDVVHAHVQKIKEGESSRFLSISDVIGPLVEPLSFENLMGEANTLGVPATVAVTTALSTTFAQAGSVPLISILDYEVLDAVPQVEAPLSSKIIFEQETLETSPEHPATS